MNPSTDANLRRLIENIKSLDPTTSAASKASATHPLGMGIKAGKTYAPIGRQHVALPAHGVAFERIKGVAAAAVPGLRAEFGPLAWGELLNSPGALFEVAVPSANDLMNEGITPAERDDCNLRRLVLGSVLRENLAPDDANGFIAPSVAAVAVLTIQITKQKPEVVDGWFKAQWVSTTRALCDALEPYVELSTSGSKGSNVEVALLLQADSAANFDSSLQVELTRTAAVCGFRLKVLKYSVGEHSHLVATLKAARPRWLLVVGEDPGVNAVRDAFTNVANVDRAVQFEATTTAEIREAVRERLIEVAGVAPSLALLSAPPAATVKPSTGRPRMRIEPKECKHSKSSGHIYVLDAKTDRWWTRDTAGHAGVVFKRYRLVDARLVHEADLDAAGNEVVGKYKGEEGRIVPVAGMHSCANPASHAE